MNGVVVKAQQAGYGTLHSWTLQYCSNNETELRHSQYTPHKIRQRFSYSCLFGIDTWLWNSRNVYCYKNQMLTYLDIYTTHYRSNQNEIRLSLFMDGKRSFVYVPYVASLCPKALNDSYSGLQRVCETLSRWCGAGPDRKVAHTQGSASHITNVDDGKLSFLVYLFYLIHQLCNTWVDLKICYVCLSNKMTQWNSRCGIGFVNGVTVIGDKTGHGLQRDPTLGDFLGTETSVVTARCFRNYISFYITVHFEDTNWPWNSSYNVVLI